MIRLFRPLPIAVLLLTSTLAGGALSASHVIAQRNRTFQPQTVAIKVGDILSVSNNDKFGHQIYVESPQMGFDSDVKDPGETIEVRFTRAGTFEVQCRIHPKMRLTVTVN